MTIYEIISTALFKADPDFNSCDDQAVVVVRTLAEAGYVIVSKRPAVPKGIGGRPKTVDDAKIRHMRLDGLSVPQIVKQTGASRASVYRSLHQGHDA